MRTTTLAFRASIPALLLLPVFAACSAAPAPTSGEPSTAPGSTASDTAEAPAARAASVAEGIVAVNRGVEDSLHLLTRLYLDGDSVMEFYEPTPGMVVVSEAGVAGGAVHHDLTNGMTPVELYRSLAPTSPVPQALLDSQARVEAKWKAQGSPKRAIPRPTSRKVRTEGAMRPLDNTQFCVAPYPGNIGSCDPTWFVNSIGCAGNDEYEEEDFSWCYLNWNGGASENDGSNDAEGDASVCASIGNLKFVFQAQSGNGTWTVNQGTYRTNWSGYESCSWPWCGQEESQSIHYEIDPLTAGAVHSYCGDFFPTNDL